MEILQALRRRWWVVVGTPLATALLAIVFVFAVTPRFQAFTTLRIVEDEGGLAGALASAPQASGGLGVLASLTGRGVPLYTEIAVLSSRDRLTELVEDLGLSVEVDEPRRTRRAGILAETSVALDGPEGVVELRRQGDGSFRVTGELLAARDPFRVVGKERYEEVDLGTVRAGGTISLEGTRIVLAPEAGEHERIVLRLLGRDRALAAVEEALSVTRPQREADVVQVAMNWTDPEVAAEAVNRLVSGYLEYREEQRAGRARRTSDFLAAQLDSVRHELAEAEEALLRFREARGVVAPEAQVTAELAGVVELKGRRDLLDAERQAMRPLLTELNEGPDPGAAARRLAFFPSMMQSQATAELIRLLGGLENERALALDRRTPEAVGIQLMDTRIREIEGELREAGETYLRGLDDQVAALDAALEGYEGALAGVPEVEMELVRQRRRLELLTQLALFLETHQKEAELTAAKEGVAAYVLAVARPPQKPLTPRPMLTVALALLVGSVLGAAAAVVLEQLPSRGRPAASPASD